MKIGLLGGSFDPPHEGHVLITRRALRRFGLDAVWWLVSPGNPLKADPPAALERRMAAANALVRHPRVLVTDVETRLGTRFTAETVARLRLIYPGVNFVWLMGADNLAGFHRWDRWQTIMDTVPVGVLSRPGEQLRAALSPAARLYAQARLPARAGRQLPVAKAPAWCLMTGPMVERSSTEIRATGAWLR
nr:nicotinate-nucleotide adenylyltransferase [Algicella marina]